MRLEASAENLEVGIWDEQGNGNQPAPTLELVLVQYMYKYVIAGY
jgi:hypothetical protein